MKFPDALEALRRPKKSSSTSKLIRVLQVSAGAASTVWLALRIRKQLYGPGGTKLTRYSQRRKAGEDDRGSDRS